MADDWHVAAEPHSSARRSCLPGVLALTGLPNVFTIIGLPSPRGKRLSVRAVFMYAAQAAAIYVPDQNQWGLCASDFDGRTTLPTTFIR